jgi:NTE family protein
LETRRNRSFIIKVLGILAACATACSSGPKIRSNPASGAASGNPAAHSGSGPPGNGELYGPALQGEAPAPPLGPIYGPEPVQIKPVTLVFGSGQARGYANAGALRAIVENHVPIAAIYGMEMGSLMGALYATEANINHFEWSLMHFKAEVFAPPQTLLGRFLAKPAGNPAALESELRQNLKAQNFSSLKIPLYVAIQPQGADRATLINEGSLVQALRISLAMPGALQPGVWAGVAAGAATGASAEQQLCDEARARYGSPVVLIETAGNSVDPSSADLVIRPDLAGIDPKDFARKTEIAFRGKSAMIDRMPELRRLVGLSPADNPGAPGLNSSPQGANQGGKP